MNAAQSSPAGLGGWLWPITWLTAALPLPPTVWLLDEPLAALYLILRHGEVPYPQTEPWWLQIHEIHAVLLFLTLCAWWWAIHWFARDPRLPRQGPWVLLACALFIERHHATRTGSLQMRTGQAPRETRKKLSLFNRMVRLGSMDAISRCPVPITACDCP